ncbi:MAG: ribosome small subunit-dependent GTPase A [Proteobacteria bacterium]|nr:ribosome small subunit-dependent GTPase A [Pseudomonadota bacterium]
MADLDLHRLGWSAIFQQQLTLEDLEHSQPARVAGVTRTAIKLFSQQGEHLISLGGRWFQMDAEFRPCVGDWVLIDLDATVIERVLDRKSLIKRLRPTKDSEVQLIAANLDTMFLVSSCNDDFNLSRAERYLALAYETDIHVVVVLTKADLVDDPEEYAAQMRTLRSGLDVELVNALDSTTLDGVRAWCGPGQTVGLLGSSGVGKSTLVNSLMGTQVQLTKTIREEDGKGRHTTTDRSLHMLPEGGFLLDSPGMRELQIADAQSGVAEMFDDIENLIRMCRFSDCGHNTEPGCAVIKALENGQLDERRLSNYFKLQREERYNSETIAQRHARARNFGKMVRQHKPKKPRV